MGFTFLLAFIWISSLLMSAQGAKSGPNVILIVADDIGYGDVSFDGIPKYNSMPTPELNRLCGKEGIVFSDFHAQSTCTPSRASLMTGRYAANTGVVFAMLPGALSGLPDNMTTLPQFLREEAGYDAHMVGKWHLGHSQRKQTPTGKGFQTHVGSLLWSMDYHTKQIWQEPWNPMLIDWVRAEENGKFEHHLNLKHSTEALTEESIDIIKKSADSDNPLFLYLAYTAAHAPLEPLEEDIKRCSHFKHLWRREHCGLIAGLDRSIGQVADAAREHLGDDVILLFTSDNGGAPFFGGRNGELRGAKTTPFEGGVRVPACMVDLGGKRFPGHHGQVVDGMMHISDFFPTLSSLAGINKDKIDQLGLDGIDMSQAWQAENLGKEWPRSSMLLEMYYGSEGEFMFADEDVVSYRKGNLKLIEATKLRDPLWWYEPKEEALSCSDHSWAIYLGEKMIRAGEALWGPGPFDSLKDILIHAFIHHTYAWVNPPILLFDLSTDPEERNNIAEQNPNVVKELQKEVAKIKRNRPNQSRFWMTIDRETQWDETLATGECDPSVIPAEKCIFAHYWIADDADLDSIELVNGLDSGPFIRSFAKALLPYLSTLFLGLYLVHSLVFYKGKLSKR